MVYNETASHWEAFSSCTHSSSREGATKPHGQCSGSLAMMITWNSTETTCGHSELVLPSLGLMLKSFASWKLLQRCLLCLPLLSSLQVPPGASTELSHQGYEFFSTLFLKYDEVRARECYLGSSATFCVTTIWIVIFKGFFFVFGLSRIGMDACRLQSWPIYSVHVEMAQTFPGAPMSTIPCIPMSRAGLHIRVSWLGGRKCDPLGSWGGGHIFFLGNQQNVDQCGEQFLHHSCVGRCWLSSVLCSLTTVLDVRQTLEYLAYLGYMYDNENQLSAIRGIRRYLLLLCFVLLAFQSSVSLFLESNLLLLSVTRERKVDLEKKQSSRTVYQCNVIGPKGVGKVGDLHCGPSEVYLQFPGFTFREVGSWVLLFLFLFWLHCYFLCWQSAFLQGLLGRNLKYIATLNKEHLSKFTINTVPVYNRECYLLVSCPVVFRPVIIWCTSPVWIA